MDKLSIDSTQFISLLSIHFSHPSDLFFSKSFRRLIPCSSQRKNSAMLDTDDSDSVSSSSTVRSDNMAVSGAEEVQLGSESLLDRCIDDLYEKRGSTREKALASIIEAFSSNLQHEFVEKNSVSREVAHIQGLRGKFLSQVRNLSTEAAGKGSAKKDLNSQRNIFRDILEFLEDGYPPETSMKIGGESLNTTSWSQLIQLNFLKHFIGGGFVKHMQENEFLHEVFGFTPKRKQLPGNEPRMSISDKDKNTGHYAVGLGDEF
ncbi:hypothetical protein TEA_016266 [Camellia sinensis var. sinensis]|uniref:Uncharacterized protein n=1 Tax=Camellia sinensis var. sinensis TaxID=542762 RepID=A0A4S4EV51_CAMSN|nr:hypothetical protein TEA_016266 [Camellia sinensis var. sinensis]